MFRALIVAAFLLALQGGALASGPDDPLPLRGQLPFKLLFLDQAPAAASVGPARQARFALHATYENTMVGTDELVHLFARTGLATYDGLVTLPLLQTVADSQPSRTAFVLDGETLRTVLDARVGIARRLEVGIEVPFLSHGRGFMDRSIDSFHDRFSLPDGGRTGFAHGEFRAGYVGNGETVYFDEPPGGFRLGDIVVSVTGALATQRGRMPAVSASLSAKLPTGNFKVLHGSGSADYGGAVRVSRKWGRATLHGGYAYNVIGEWRLAPGVPLHDSRSLYAAWAFSVTPRTHVVVQALRTRGPFPFRSGNDLGKVAMEFSAGFRYRLPGGVALEWAFVENLEPFYNTPDVGSFFGVSYSTSPAPPATGNHPTPPPSNP